MAFSFHSIIGDFFLKGFLFCIRVQLINNVVMVSGELAKGLSPTATCIHSPSRRGRMDTCPIQGHHTIMRRVPYHWRFWVIFKLSLEVQADCNQMTRGLFLYQHHNVKLLWVHGLFYYLVVLLIQIAYTYVPESYKWLLAIIPQNKLRVILSSFRIYLCCFH